MALFLENLDERTRRLMDVLHGEYARGRLPGAVAVLSRGGRMALLESLGLRNELAPKPLAAELGRRASQCVCTAGELLKRGEGCA